jgi:hypothetical protein
MERSRFVLSPVLFTFCSTGERRCLFVHALFLFTERSRFVLSPVLFTFCSPGRPGQNVNVHETFHEQGRTEEQKVNRE